MKFEWVVPVVVLIVWLVSTILKSRENDEPVRPRQPGGGDGRRPTSDIDRFLQEIDRLKRKSAEERAEATRPTPPPVVRPVQPVPRPRPVKPVRLEAVPEVVVVEPAPVIKPAPRTMQSPAPTKASRPTAAGRSFVTIAALNLLRSPQSLAGAMVLQEVLGPPKCRRS
jgi:hypothetical protein